MLPPQAQAGSPFFSALRSGLRNKGLQAFNGIAFGECHFRLLCLKKITHCL